VIFIIELSPGERGVTYSFAVDFVAQVNGELYRHCRRQLFHLQGCRKSRPTFPEWLIVGGVSLGFFKEFRTQKPEALDAGPN